MIPDGRVMERGCARDRRNREICSSAAGSHDDGRERLPTRPGRGMGAEGERGTVCHAVNTDKIPILQISELPPAHHSLATQPGCPLRRWTIINKNKLRRGGRGRHLSLIILQHFWADTSHPDVPSRV